MENFEGLQEKHMFDMFNHDVRPFPIIVHRFSMNFIVSATGFQSLRVPPEKSLRLRE